MARKATKTRAELIALCFRNALAYQRVHGGKLVCGAVGYKMYEMGNSHRPYVDLHYGE